MWTYAQRGVALLTAMLIVSLATVTAVAAFSQQYMRVRFVENALHNNLAHRYLMGAEEWAAVILHRDGQESDIDHDSERWARKLPPIPVEGGFVGGSISELQGLLNLNNIVDKDGKADNRHLSMFRRLLVNLRLDPDLANAVVDWLDADFDTTPPGGAEDGYYLRAEPPYRAGNRPYASRTELRLVKGIDADVYQKLVSHVAVLPRGTGININTAPTAILQSLADGLSSEDAKALAAVRDRSQGYTSVEEFLTHDILAGKEIDASLLTVKSDYFSLSAIAGVGRVEATQVSLISRLPGADIVVLSRRGGPL